jgi:hypothetical protein
MNFLNTAVVKESSEPVGVLNYLDLDSTESDLDKISDLGLKVKTKMFQLETFSISSKFHKELKKDLKFLHGMDLNEMIQSTLNNEVNVQNNNLLRNKYFSLGEINRKKELRKSSWYRFLLRFIPESHFSFHFDSADSLTSKILTKSNHIGVRSRRGNGDFIICPPKYSTYIMESPSFVYKEIGKISEGINHVDFIGTISDKIQVFVDRNASFSEDRILIGKRTVESNPGVYFISGNKSTEEFTDTYGDKKITLLRRQAVINTEGCEGQFDVIRVSDSKRPFWKKLLGIR